MRPRCSNPAEHIVTPGAVDSAATLGVVCNGRTRDRRHVTAAKKTAALALCNIPAAQVPYNEFDRLIPPAIGGANSLANLWPQPWAEADEKNVLEVELQRRVCHGRVSQAEAQCAIADDWTEAYRRYVGGQPKATPGYDDEPTASIATPRQSLRARRGAAWRALNLRNAIGAGPARSTATPLPPKQCRRSTLWRRLLRHCRVSWINFPDAV